MVPREQLDAQLQQFDFDALAGKQPDARRRLRLLGLAHLKAGKSYMKVARSLRVTRHAVMRCADWFATVGIERLAGVPQSGRPPRITKEREEAVRRAIEQAQDARGGGRIRGEEIRQLLRAQFQVEYSLNGVYHLLERLGMSWISVRSISPQTDLAAQATFKKTFAVQVQSVVPPHVRSEQIDIWFQDEMRIGQRGTQTRLWARKGTRPRVVRQQQSESTYIFGAFCPAQDCAAGLVLPHANTQTMGHHLQPISAAVPAGHHAVLLLDRAGWHTTLNLPQLANVSLLPLPTGSPELNAAEQVWQQLRDRYLANRCFDSYAQIVDACCDAWNGFTAIPGALRSLCSRSWANLNQQPFTS